MRRATNFQADYDIAVRLFIEQDLIGCEKPGTPTRAGIRHFQTPRCHFMAFNYNLLQLIGKLARCARKKTAWHSRPRTELDVALAVPTATGYGHILSKPVPVAPPYIVNDIRSSLHFVILPSIIFMIKTHCSHQQDQEV